MKFKYGDFPQNEEFQPEKEGFKPLKEPNIIMAQILGLPIAIIVVGLLYYIGTSLLSVKLDFSDNFLLGFLIVVPIHEMLHALCFPGDFKSEHLIFGFYTKGLAFYAYYNEEMPRNTFITSLLCPFIGISIVPLIIMIIFNINNNFLFLIILINALAGYVDLLNVFIMMFQLPSNAMLKNKGWKSYWKI